jgi:DNA modification methylase
MKEQEQDTTESRSTINLHLGDCLEAMRVMPDNAFDLAMCDIPYGLGDKLSQGGTWANKYKKGDASWDVLPSEEYFNELFRVSSTPNYLGRKLCKFTTNKMFFNLG